MVEGIIISTKKLSDENFLYELVVEAVEVHKMELISIVKNQIRNGVKGDGSRTAVYTNDKTSYSTNYYVAKVKKKKAPQMPHRNYENEGDFLGSMFAFANGIDMWIGSDDEKNRYIEGEEGEELFKLTDENIVEFASIWKPTFINLIYNEIFKSIS